MPILFALVGATGVGKSNLSLELAERYHAEIVGVDSRQVYRDFAIGTAQPPKTDLQRVPHHLVNFVEPERAYSAGDFCADVKGLLREFPEKNFILVGGTGLYLQSLMLGLPKIPKVAPALRAGLEDEAEKAGVESMFRRASLLDPEAMANVDVNNLQRIIRVLEVYESTGRKLSEWQKEREGGIGSLPVFWLDRSRENLYARIDSRVDKMMADGWLDEIVNLSKTVPLTAPAWQSLGYRELLSARGASEIESVLDEVKRKTRNYAKRQLTWFRWQVKTVRVDLDVVASPAECIERSLNDLI